MRLRYEIKAINKTVVEKGLVTLMLVFGATLSLENSKVSLSGQSERIRDLKRAHDDEATLIPETIVRRALKSNISPSAHFHLKTGQTVTVYSEKNG